MKENLNILPRKNGLIDILVGLRFQNDNLTSEEVRFH